MLSTVELQVKIEEWRLKAKEGTLTLEDTKEAIAYLRAGRVAAAESTSTKPRAKEKVTVDGAAMLASMMGL